MAYQDITGTAENNRRLRIRLVYNTTPGSTTCSVTAYLYVEAVGSYPYYDTSNFVSLTHTGTTSTSSNVAINSSGSPDSGPDLIKQYTKNVTVSLTASTNHSFSGYITGFDVISDGRLDVSGSISIPAAGYAEPTAPTGLSVTRVSDSEYTINYTNNATTGAPYTTFQLWRSTDDGAAELVKTASGSSVTDDTTSANHKYKWYLYVENTAGSDTSSYTGEYASTPATPTGLSVSRPTILNVLEWTDNATWDAGYEIWRAIDDGSFELFDTTSASAELYSDEIDRTYMVSYKVRAKSTTGGTLYSSFSSTVIVNQLIGVVSDSSVAMTSETVDVEMAAIIVSDVAHILYSDSVDVTHHKLLVVNNAEHAIVNEMASTYLLHMGMDSPFDDMYFAQVDRNNILFSDGFNGLWCYPGYGEFPDSTYRVVDKVPFLDDNNGDPGVTMGECPYAPSGQYLTFHRGRLFMAEPGTSKVYYSGTITSYDDGETPATAIKPWELWNSKLDLSRANVGHGANMVIGSPSEKLNGIIDSEDGIIAFKENQVLLWSWPDTAAPHEVTQGAYVTEIARNVGLVSYRTLVRDRGTLFFLGMIENSKHRIFALSGGSVTNITVNVDNLMDKIVNPETARGSVQGNYYILFADTGDGVKPFIGVNTETGAIVELDGPEITSSVIFDAYGKLVIGTDYGAVLQYPSTAMHDHTGMINYEIAAQRTTASQNFHDHKFRKFWVSIDTLMNDEPVSREEDLKIELVYDDDSVVYDREANGRDVVYVNTSKRSRGAKMIIRGLADGPIRINAIGIATRDRKVV